MKNILLINAVFTDLPKDIDNFNLTYTLPSNVSLAEGTLISIAYPNVSFPINLYVDSISYNLNTNQTIYKLENGDTSDGDDYIYFTGMDTLSTLIKHNWKVIIEGDMNTVRKHVNTKVIGDMNTH